MDRCSSSTSVSPTTHYTDCPGAGTTGQIGAHVSSGPGLTLLQDTNLTGYVLLEAYAVRLKACLIQATCPATLSSANYFVTGSGYISYCVIFGIITPRIIAAVFIDLRLRDAEQSLPRAPCCIAVAPSVQRARLCGVGDAAFPCRPTSDSVNSTRRQNSLPTDLL